MKQMMIFAGMYQNNGTGRDTFIQRYRRGIGRNSEPGAYQGNCGVYPGGMTKFTGFAPYVLPEEVVDTKPYSCHKELGLARPSTAPHVQVHRQRSAALAKPMAHASRALYKDPGL